RIQPKSQGHFRPCIKNLNRNPPPFQFTSAHLRLGAKFSANKASNGLDEQGRVRGKSTSWDIEK
ncbi:hypothetical protein LINPERHAP2_LOCUS33362, partial [Linum perenne]